jgi:hypothetical protein
MYQTLPKYQRLPRFLPLLAFGPGILMDKIIDNAEDNRSDVVRQLAITTPLSDEDRLLLQKKIMESGWFEVSSFVEISHIVEQYGVQCFWVDRGIEVEPEDLHQFTNHHSRKTDLLLVGSRDENGAYHSLDIQREKLTVELFCEDIDVAYYHEYSPESVDFVRMLEIRYIPNKLLQVPLPRLRFNLRHYVLHQRLTRPMPDFFRFLNERYSTYSQHWGIFVISAAAIEHAISEAISTYNHSFLNVIINLPLCADGRTRLNPVTAEHFIAAAQRLDGTALELLWQKSYSPFANGVLSSTWPQSDVFSKENMGAFPFKNIEVIAWMKHAEREAQGSPCSNLHFIHYIKYFRERLLHQNYVRVVSGWRHTAHCKCKLKSQSGPHLVAE